MLRVFCGPALVQIVSNDAGENKNRTSDKMNEHNTDTLEELNAIREAELDYVYEAGISIEDADL